MQVYYMANKKSNGPLTLSVVLLITFLRTGICKLSPLPQFVFLMTYGVFPNAYNNNKFE